MAVAGFSITIKAAFEVTANSELLHEEVDQAERCIEQAFSLMLLELSGDGRVIIYEVSLVPISRS